MSESKGKKNVNNERKIKKRVRKEDHGKERKPEAKSKPQRNNQKKGTVVTGNPQIVKKALQEVKLGDARSAVGPITGFQNQITVPYTSSGASIVPQLSDEAIYSYAAGLVSKALVRGLKPEDAAPALQMISEVLKAQALNTDPLVNDMPGYLQVIANALRPRTVTYLNNAYNYSWGTTSTTINAPVALPYGNTNNRGAIVYGTISEVNPGPFGLPTINTNGTYTTDQKKLSFSRFTSIMAQGDNGTSAPMTPAEWKAISHDTSALAAGTIIDGFAIAGQGGTIVRLGSEGPINFPVLSRFVTMQGSFRDYNRACNVNSEAGGGPMELALFSSIHRTFALGQISKPVIKFVDALSLTHVYFKSWQFALEQYAASAEFKVLLAQGTQYAEAALRDRAIPVTFEEAQIALRNEYMKSFADTQSGTQSLGPTTEVNESWLGYSCGVGTAPCYEVDALFMPGPFAENLRALSAVTVYDARDWNTEKILRNKPVLTSFEQHAKNKNKLIRPFLPVLGSFTNAELFASDYFVNYQDNQKISLFWPKDTVKDEKKKEKEPMSPMAYNKKGARVKEVTTIRMNDGSIGNGYVALNDPQVLARIIGLMNRALTKNINYFAGLTQNSNQPAANILKLGGVNAHMYTTISGEAANYLDDTILDFMSFGYPPNKVVTEQFKRVMPMNLYGSRDNSYLKACNDRETEYIIVGSREEPVTLHQQLDAVAMLNISDGHTSNIQKKLNALSAQGDGGIFSDIATALNPLVTVSVGALAKGLDTFL